ncbi:hypothetical protein PUN28_013940 [Cardiocondyla obscurior]|uniref:USP domain-containing protein n=1 Tax=Cardiocondyla obscurior TaxID=286306 RepID=A0AAW2F3S3_9HYME
MQHITHTLPLKIFPQKITVNNDIYLLVGIVHYSSRSNVSVGHYTAYALYGNNWVLFDDLLANFTHVNEDSIINPTICLYVKQKIQ